jgi:hypothetical protein
MVPNMRFTINPPARQPTTRQGWTDTWCAFGVTIDIGVVWHQTRTSATFPPPEMPEFGRAEKTIRIAALSASPVPLRA